MLGYRWLIATSLLSLAPAAAMAGEANALPPPPFLSDRTAEDHAYLRDPARRGDWSDGYKFIPLDGGGRSHLSLGGELRERIEAINAPRFGLAGEGDDGYLLQRLLLHADLRVDPRLRLFAQLGAHEAFGKDRIAPPDEDRLDVHQLFVELTPAAGLSARLGRQEMAFNPLQRFVSFRDGTNVRQNFDGGRATWNRGPLRIEGFVTRPVTPERGSFDNHRNAGQMFSGLYASHALAPQGRLQLDAFWFLLERDDSPGGSPAGRERRHSFGLRFAGTRGGFDWDVEAVYQRGDAAGRDIRAWAGSIDLGISWREAPLRPRLGFRFDAGSGDDIRHDRIGGFHPLFPSGPYFNEANLTSWTNLLAPRLMLRVQPATRLMLLATAQHKWREDRDGPVSVGPSAPLVGTAQNRGREIGQVYTLDAQLQVNRNLGLRAYYLRHNAGDAIRAAGGRPVDFFMASATLRF